MTVSLNSFASSANGSTDRTASITIGANTKGILVFVVQALGTDQVTSITLDDGATTAIPQIAAPADITTGDIGYVYAHFLGSGLPAAGTYTVTAAVSGSANKRMGVYVLDGAADLEVVDYDTSIQAGAQTNPSVTLSLGGRTSFCALGGFMGGGSTGDYTPLTDWDGTTNGFEQDQATNGTAVYSYNTIGSSDVTAGWTQSSDEAAMFAVAVSEVVGGGPTEETGSLTAATSAGASFSAIASAYGLVTADLEVSDSDSGLAAALAAVTAAASSSDQWSAIAAALGAIQEGLELGETWAAIAAADANLTASINFGATFSGLTLGTQDAAITAATSASAAFLGAVAAYALLQDGATAGAAFAAQAAVADSVNGAVSIGSSFSGDTGGTVGSITAAAALEAAYSSIAATLGGLSAEVAFSDALAGISAAIAALSAAVALGVVFSASTSRDISIVGATASIQAIRRLKSSVVAINVKTATIN